MFWIKKMMGNLLMPMPLALTLLLVGLLLLLLTQRQRMGKVLCCLSWILLTLFSLFPVANHLLIPLEQQYPPFTEPAQIDFILVLGHGHTSDPAIPLTSQPSHTAMARIMEGIALKQRHPGARMILSGSTASDPVSCARMYAQIAEYYGIPASEIELVEGALDTRDEMQNYKRIIGNHKAALVTSASHMPRAMRMATSVGLNVIPAPTDFQAKRPQTDLPIYAYLPKPESLNDSEMALHEWLGLLWNELVQQVNNWTLSSTKTDVDQ